jgi:hypothetical protein
MILFIESTLILLVFKKNTKKLRKIKIYKKKEEKRRKEKVEGLI